MRKINILIVDDQISSLIALEDILESIDANIIKSDSAKEALLIMLKKPIDCVLLDVSMPEMDGFEFLKTLSSAPAHAKIPVIMITGKIFSENETLRAYKYGAVDFLLKPLTPETVYRKVSFIVQQAKRINSIMSMEQHFENIQSSLISPLTQIINTRTNQQQRKDIIEKAISTLTEINSLWGDVHSD